MEAVDVVDVVWQLRRLQRDGERGALGVVRCDYRVLFPQTVVRPREVDHGVVVDGCDEVSVFHVVDPRNVLVANAFDAVCAKTVV